jgi:type IV pilus biogenesis protein CpaD/CtpE
MADRRQLAIPRPGTKGRDPWHHERPPVRSRLAAAVLLGLAACAGPVETRRTVPADLADVRGRIVAELARLGFGPASASASGGRSVIEAAAARAPDEWASCGPTFVDVGGPDESPRMATAEAERGAVRVELTPVGGGGTEVDVTAAFTGGYRNPNTTYRFERVCRSNGVLEARLLAAAAG